MLPPTVSANGFDLALEFGQNVFYQAKVEWRRKAGQCECRNRVMPDGGQQPPRATQSAAQHLAVIGFYADLLICFQPGALGFFEFCTD
jgi:hypothetical protein